MGWCFTTPRQCCFLLCARSRCAQSRALENADVRTVAEAPDIVGAAKVRSRVRSRRYARWYAAKSKGAYLTAEASFARRSKGFRPGARCDGSHLGSQRSRGARTYCRGARKARRSNGFSMVRTGTKEARKDARWFTQALPGRFRELAIEWPPRSRAVDDGPGGRPNEG